MSTDINLNELYNNSVKILTDLISFRTISGEDNSALINYCEDYLHKLGATSFKTFDEEKKRVPRYLIKTCITGKSLKTFTSPIDRKITNDVKPSVTPNI